MFVSLHRYNYSACALDSHVLARELGVMSSIKPVGKKRASSPVAPGTKRSRVSVGAMESSFEEETEETSEMDMSQLASQDIQEAEQKSKIRIPQVSIVLSVCSNCMC